MTGGEVLALTRAGVDPAVIAKALALEVAQEDWQARGRTTWEGAVVVGVRNRDINAAAEDLRASRSWD